MGGFWGLVFRVGVQCFVFILQSLAVRPSARNVPESIAASAALTRPDTASSLTAVWGKALPRICMNSVHCSWALPGW